EQIMGSTIRPETDIYSLGLVLYELLTGKKAFEATASPANLLHKHLNDPIPPLRELRPDLPESLNSVLQRATAKDPDQRYPDAKSLAAAFRAALEAPEEASVPRIPAPQTVSPVLPTHPAGDSEVAGQTPSPVPPSLSRHLRTKLRVDLAGITHMRRGTII